MPVALKQNQLKYKNPDTGTYVSVDAVAEKTTAEMVAEVESAGQAKISAINTRAAEVQASLPKVGEMEDIVAVPFVQNDPYPEGAYVIHTVNGVNYLYKLPDGHTAGVAWGEFEVDGPLTFSEELNNTVKELVAVQDEQPTAPENKVWLTETPPEPIVVPTYDEYNDTKKYVDDLLDHETYAGGPDAPIQYEPVTEQTHVNNAFLMINGYNYATIATPTNATVRIYRVELGKTYKVVSRGNNTKERPLLIVTDTLVESGAIAGPNEYDYAVGTSSSTIIEEMEYVALRNGYLYLTASDQTCGLWEKITEVRYYYIDDVRQSVSTLITDVESISGTLESVDSAINTLNTEVESVSGVADIVDEIIAHETYEGSSTPSTVYEPVAESAHVDDAFVMINGYNYATISKPTDANVRIFPVTIGKTYKVVSRGKDTNSMPLLLVADSLVESGAISAPNGYDYVLGTHSTATVEEIEYTTLRTGYLYLNSTGASCGLWEKKVTPPSTRKYHIDDVLRDVAYTEESIVRLNGKVFQTKVDDASSMTKVVPRNAEYVAKVSSLDESVTLVRSIISRNVADKDSVGDVAIDAAGTLKKGIKTVHLPAGNYYIILGDVGPYTIVKMVDNGVYTTLYKDQFPMTLHITDPGGGYFIVYASSVSALGDVSGIMIGRLGDNEDTLTFDPYIERTYSPAKLEEDSRIEVRPYGIIEFVNENNVDVASTVEYMVSGKEDDTTTRKDFIISPDGSKFLPMVNDDGSISCARVVPRKALFIGNSLTSGWQTFGESATEHDKDFVWRFSAAVTEMEPSYTFNRKWSTQFEQRTSLADAQTWVTNNIDPLLSPDLDLIVVQLCENVVGNASAAATFPSSSLWLMRHLRSECPKARVIWMGLWFERRWAPTLLENTKNAGCEYVDIRQLYLPENNSEIGTLYQMESDYAKTYAVDSFTVDNGQITLEFTVNSRQYTATIPSYTSYTSSSDTSITVTGVYHIVSTYYESIHPNDEGFRRIANKLLYDLGITDDKDFIPQD